MSKSFSNTIPEKDNLLIVDGFNLAFRYKHSNKRNFAAEYVQTVLSFAQSYGAKRIVILSDGGSSYRNDIYPEYKGNRKLLKETQTPEEKEAFDLFMEDWLVAFELCETIGITIRYGGVEADDIAAYLATDEAIQKNFNHIWLLSTDGDWDLLIKDNISRFSYRSRKEFTISNWNDHYGYRPEDHISVKVLQGDKGDHIPGVEGIGEKRAATLVKQYGTAYDVLSALPIQDKKVYIQNLNKFGNQIITNYELMDLESYCGDALGENVSDLENKIEEIIT